MSRLNAPEQCEGCVFLHTAPNGRNRCHVFYKFLPKGWVNEDGTCQAYRRVKEDKRREVADRR